MAHEDKKVQLLLDALDVLELIERKDNDLPFDGYILATAIAKELGVRDPFMEDD